MKSRLFLLNFLVIFFVTYSAVAQGILVSVSVKSPYSMIAKNYLQQGDNVVFTLMNNSLSPRSVRVYTSVEGVNNDVSIQYLPNYVGGIQSLVFSPGETKIISLNQLQLYNRAPGPNDLRFSNYDSRTYFSNGLLPEGLYKICAHIKYDSMPQAETVRCASLWIRGYDPPIVLNPQHESVVEPLKPQNILFNWMPTGVPGKTFYRFKLMDLSQTPVNNPNDAFKKKVTPFYQEENIVASTLVYDNTKPALIVGHKYALQIEAYDVLNKQLFKNEGNSQVIVFLYEKKKITVEGGDATKTDETSGN